MGVKRRLGLGERIAFRDRRTGKILGTVTLERNTRKNSHLDVAFPSVDICQLPDQKHQATHAPTVGACDEGNLGGSS